MLVAGCGYSVFNLSPYDGPQAPLRCQCSPDGPLASPLGTDDVGPDLIKSLPQLWQGTQRLG